MLDGGCPSQAVSLDIRPLHHQQFPTCSMDAIVQITDVQEAFRAFNRRDFDKAESLFTKYAPMQNAYTLYARHVDGRYARPA